MPIGNLQTHNRYRQLDSLRGLAALCVFLSHYVLIFNYSGNRIDLLRQSPLGVLINGRAAVIFFFVLSGFVLSLPFINSDKPLRLGEFYIKRIFRIYPAYWFAIIIAVILKSFIYQPAGIQDFSPWLNSFWGWHWDSHHINEIIKTALIIGPHFNADFIDPVIWSLVVEMQMSLLLPFFIMLVAKSNTSLNILFFVITLVLIYNRVVGFLGIFYLGILLAKYRHYFENLVNKLSRPPLFIIILLCIVAYNIGGELPYDYHDRHHPFQFFWRDYLNALSCCIIIIVALYRKQTDLFLNRKTFIFFGEISYSFYLLHLPLLITLCSLLPTAGLFSFISIFFLSLIVAGSLAYLSLKFIERPFQQIAKKLIKRLPEKRFAKIPFSF